MAEPTGFYVYTVVGPALPPTIYEIINCAYATMATIVAIEALRYLIVEYRESGQFWSLRLAVGTGVFFCGEAARMWWVWLARYIENTGGDPRWMGHGLYVAVPITGSCIGILGMACIARAIVPIAWGRRAYMATLAAALVMVLATRVFR